MQVIPKAAEYALRALVYLAHHPEGRMSARQIALVTQAPASRLAKILEGLGEAGLVRSCRGRSGGFSLARRPDELTALDVINAVAPLKRVVHCPLGLAEAGLCSLHQRLNDAVELLERSFGDTRLSDLLICPVERMRFCVFRGRAPRTAGARPRTAPVSSTSLAVLPHA